VIGGTENGPGWNYPEIGDPDAARCIYPPDKRIVIAAAPDEIRRVVVFDPAEGEEARRRRSQAGAGKRRECQAPAERLHIRDVRGAHLVDDARRAEIVEGVIAVGRRAGGVPVAEIAVVLVVVPAR